MSVYSNATIAHRFKDVFSVPRSSLSHELKAVLAAVTVWAMLLGVISMHDTPENIDLHSSTNIEDIRIDAPEADQGTLRLQRY